MEEACCLKADVVGWQETRLSELRTRQAEQRFAEEGGLLAPGPPRLQGTKAARASAARALEPGGVAVSAHG
eukprot:7246704-Alexandrium_andersonii.AAC.1